MRVSPRRAKNMGTFATAGMVLFAQPAGNLGTGRQGSVFGLEHREREGEAVSSERCDERERGVKVQRQQSGAASREI